MFLKTMFCVLVFSCVLLIKIQTQNLELTTQNSLKTKGPAEADPLVLTNPLNSCTKLQIAATVQNNFCRLLKTFGSFELDAVLFFDTHFVYK